MKDKIEYYLIKGLRASMMLFPLKIRYAIFEQIGVLAYHVIKKRRVVTINNLKGAFPEKTEKEIIEIAKKSYRNMAKMMVVTAYLKEVTDRNDTIVENEEIVDNEFAKGKGIIIASLHLGAFEAGCKMSKTKKVYAIFRSQKNKKLNELMVKYRIQAGMNTIMKGDTESLNKALKEKPLLALVTDHYTNDIEISFFGRKTMAASGAVLLGLKYKIPIVYIYAIFDKDGIKIVNQEVVNIEKKENLKETVKYNTQKLFYLFEETIRKYPEQYMWQHKRWR